MPLAVGIERRVESTLGRSHLARHPLDRLDRNALHLVILCRLPEVCAKPGEQSVVVQHLLEMGHEPNGIDGVAGESAADLIIDPPTGHFLEGCQDYLQNGLVSGSLPVPEKEIQGHRGGKLWSGAESAILGIVVLGEQTVRDLENLWGKPARAPRSGKIGLVDLLELLCSLSNSIASLRIGVGDGLKYAPK